MSAAPVAPDYDDAGITCLLAALAARAEGVPRWLPARVCEATQVVVLVLDGLGWEQLEVRRHLTPAMGAMAASPVTSVAPTTTSVALTSIVTGRPPADHGVVGYRVMVAGRGVLNVLRWSMDGADAREVLPPADERRCSPFQGMPVPVITRAEFARSGFTEVAFDTGRFIGWKAPSSIPVEVAACLEAGQPLVYAYYDGVDKIAHAHGLGAHYDAEVAAADALVAAIQRTLPTGAVLVVTSDHGQVEVGERVIELSPDVVARCSGYSGEGRFLWLHGDDVESIADAARRAHDGEAWVRTYAEVVADGWLGGIPDAAIRSRLGDVALLARADVAFSEPGEGPSTLVARHGSLTSAEVLVPVLVGWS